MKQRITSALQLLIADRYLSVLMVVFLAFCFVALIFLAVAIHPSERQVAVHYTSFGTTNFYRDKWYYLLNFAGFTVLLATLHTLITYKIFQAKGRALAIPFVWLGIVVVGISIALFYQILRVASII